jgi:hypothetical protein
LILLLPLEPNPAMRLIQARRNVAIVMLGMGFGLTTVTVARAAQTTKRETKLGDWRLTVLRSRFSGETTCRLRSRDGRAIYANGALGFRFRQHLDVTNAWYRLDGGAPHRWRDARPTLARLGIAIDGRAMDAPTDGIVWLPAAWLEAINRVDIQPVPGRKARSFHQRGFTGLREIARAAGCTSEQSFIA